MIRLGSLCTGVGGLDLAVAAHLAVDHRWHAETDPAASTVLAAHWPDVPNLGDITSVGWPGPRGRRADRASAGRAREVDVLTAGFPCQPFSAAGKRAGTGDERHLWPTGVLPAIDALRPPMVVLENVPGLLAIQRGRVFGTVLADLDALGYAISWTTVGACKVGACHHRHRVFIAAALVDVDPPDGALFGLPLAVVKKWPPAGMVRDGLMWEMPADTWRIADNRGTPSPQTAAARIAAGRRNLEDAVALLPTPRAIDGTSGRQTLIGGRTVGDRGPRLSDIGTLLPTPTARDATRGAGRTFAEGHPLSEVIALLPTPTASDGTSGPGHAGSAQGSPDLRTTIALLSTLAPTSAVQPGRFGRFEAAVRRQETTFGTPAPEPTEPGRLGKPRLTAAFPEWMLGFPAGWITGHVGRADAIRCAGNGVSPAQGAYALGLLPTFQAAVEALTVDRLAEVAA